MRTISPGQPCERSPHRPSTRSSTLSGQSAGLCGQISQVAACRSHSAGIEKPSAAGVEVESLVTLCSSIRLLRESLPFGPRSAKARGLRLARRTKACVYPDLAGSGHEIAILRCSGTLRLPGKSALCKGNLPPQVSEPRPIPPAVWQPQNSQKRAFSTFFPPNPPRFLRFPRAYR